MATIGENISTLRKKLGMTQEELAKAVGYKSRSAINKIELGINDVPRGKLKAFSEALGTSPAELCGYGFSQDHSENVGDSFMVGVNYWASNAGTYMWRDFDINTIERDFALLRENGADTVRLFPLWSDFQPVTDALVGSNHTHHLRVKDQPLKTPAGLDSVMLERFGLVLDLCEKYELKVIVGLITGWMSGRLFAPELLMNKNLLTDPLSIVWACKFIREFIPHFKDRKCIVAWEPGNECNCLTVPLRNRDILHEQAELWVSAITGAIRSADNTRPVYSGMYSNDLENPFSVTMLKEYVDVQTTHPYPLFTPYCAMEGLTTMRAALHSAAHAKLFADVTGQPCMVEEIGTLGPNVLSDDFTPEYYEKSFWSSLQYGANGYLWWCGFNQDGFDFPPYDGSAIERQLGLAYADGTPKPTMAKMAEMKKAADELCGLPSAKSDAVVILTNPKEAWKHTYGAFCLAAQAGKTVDFMYRSSPLKDSDLYIIPSVSYDTYLKFTDELIERVERGAKLLITYDYGNIFPFEKLTGLRVKGREKASKKMKFELSGKEIVIPTQTSLVLEAAEAEVLARSGEDIVLSKSKLGNGEVYFLNAPIESAYTESYDPASSTMCEVYKAFFKGTESPFALDSNKCTVTYHEKENKALTVLITRFDERTEIPFTLNNGYAVESSKYCGIVNNTVHFDKFYAVIELSK